MLDDVTARLAQHFADIAEAVAGAAEELGRLPDIHRGVVGHAGDGELDAVHLVGDGLERLEMGLAPSDGRHGTSPLFKQLCLSDSFARVGVGHVGEAWPRPFE